MTERDDGLDLSEVDAELDEKPTVDPSAPVQPDAVTTSPGTPGAARDASTRAPTTAPAVTPSGARRAFVEATDPRIFMEQMSEISAWAGSMLGRYRAVAFLGSGGMADIYRCELPGAGGFSKTVLVKRLKPALADNAEFIAMFLDEARLAARLNHQNIVQVFEVGSDGSVPFLAMELVRGPSLGRLMREAHAQKKWNTPLFIRALADVLQGLQAAHEARDETGQPLGVVHRDVSPQNIVISSEGVPKLIDFGVAKAARKLVETKVGLVVGKLHYMAPEQVESKAVDGRADIYAIGVCLYQAVTRRLPFQGHDDLALMRLRIQGEFRKPSDLVAGVDPALEAIILRALAADPAARYQSAGELHAALDAWLRPFGSRADSGALGRFIREIYPDVDKLFEGKSAGDLGTPARSLGGGTPTSDRVAGTPATSAASAAAQAAAVSEDTPRRRRSPAVIGIALGACASAVVAIGLVWVTTHSGASGPSGAPATADVWKILDEAKEAVVRREPSPALELVARARTLPVDARDARGVADAEDHLERDARMMLAESALAAGDVDGARRNASRALELAPGDTAAKAIFAKAALPTPVAVVTPPVPQQPVPASPPVRAPIVVKHRGGSRALESKPVEPPAPPTPAVAVSPPTSPTVAPAAVAVAPAAPTPVAPPVASAPREPTTVPTPAAAQDPGLPTRFQVRSRTDVVQVCRSVEAALKARGHLAPELADDVTAALAASVAPKMTAGSFVDLSPAAIYWTAVGEAKRGRAKQDISRALVDAFTSGRLRPQ